MSVDHSLLYHTRGARRDRRDSPRLAFEPSRASLFASPNTFLFLKQMVDNAQMQQFLEEEKRKAVFNEVVAKITDVCFEKCVTSSPGSSFTRHESSCVTSCALRYLESGQVVLGRLQNMSGGA